MWSRVVNREPTCHKSLVFVYLLEMLISVVRSQSSIVSIVLVDGGNIVYGQALAHHRVFRHLL